MNKKLLIVVCFLFVNMSIGCSSVTKTSWSPVNAPWISPNVRSDFVLEKHYGPLLGGHETVYFAGKESIDANQILDDVYRLVKKHYSAMSATAKFTVISFRPLLVVLSEEKSAYAVGAFPVSASPFVVQNDLVSDIPPRDPYIISSRQHVFSTMMHLNDARVVICKLADGNTKTAFVSDILIDGVWVVDGHEFKFFADDGRLSIEYVRNRSMQRSVSDPND